MNDKPNNETPAEDNQTGDTSAETKNTAPELTDEQWEVAFQHPRFKELTQAKSEYEQKMQELETQRKEEQEAKLKEEKKWQTLAEQREQELSEYKQRIETQTKQQSVYSEAVKAGAVNPDVVVKLVDATQINTNEDGTNNAGELVGKLLEENPYLKGKANPDAGQKTTTSNNENQKRTYTESEIRQLARDGQWMADNQEEYYTAFSEGRVEMGK